MTTIITGGSTPRALVFSPTDDGELVAALSKYGVEARVVSDPKAFLSEINGGKNALHFLVVQASAVKIVSALLKSIRKVLGLGLPIYAVLDLNDSGLSPDLLDWGATGVLLRPVDTSGFAEILMRNVATDQVRAAVQERTAVTKTQAAPPPKEVEEENAIPSAKDIPPIVTWVFEEVFPVMASLSTVIENLDEIETRVKFYSERMVTYRELFVGMVNGMRRGGDEQALNLSQCVRFYGLLNTKLFVVGERMAAVARGQPIAWDEQGKKPKEEPKKVISYAASLLTAYGEDSLYREVAFSSGLVFDLFTILAEGAGDRKAALKKEIEQRAKKAKERADAALQKAKQQSQMPLAKHIVSGFFMTEAARIAMAFHYPQYLDMLKAFEKGKIRVGHQHIAEEAKFKVSHNIIAALLCQVTPGLSPAARGTLLARYPFVLAKAGAKSADSLSLAQILNQPF